jgi:hypothetical protein
MLAFRLAVYHGIGVQFSPQLKIRPGVYMVTELATDNHPSRKKRLLAKLICFENLQSPFRPAISFWVSLPVGDFSLSNYSEESCSLTVFLIAKKGNKYQLECSPEWIVEIPTKQSIVFSPEEGRAVVEVETRKIKGLELLEIILMEAEQLGDH